MGFPIKTVRDFEEGLKRRPQKCAFLLFLNPYSDSRSAMVILSNFSLLDQFSKEIDFYVPGFSRAFGGEGNLSHMNNFAADVYSDFHTQKEPIQSYKIRIGDDEMSVRKGNYVTHLRIRGRGEYYFNQAEFAEFAMEVTCKSKDKFYYMGGTQLVCIEVDENANPVYEYIECFDLDEVALSHHGPSLDRFMFEAFQIARSCVSFEMIAEELKSLYERSTLPRQENKRRIIVQNTIMSMENLLGWRFSEPFYFISYSSRNQGMAFEIKRRLEERNLNVWMAPDGIPQGGNYAMTVPLAVNHCDTFILLLTPEAAESKWVIREIDRAVNGSKKIKIVLHNFTIEDLHADPELVFYLNKVQIKYQFKDSPIDLFSPSPSSNDLGLPSILSNFDQFIAE